MEAINKQNYWISTKGNKYRNDGMTGEQLVVALKS